MPPERSRSSKQNGADALTWTVPVEPFPPQSIAFAPTLTPITFNEPPPSVDSFNDSVLFPPNSDCPSRRPGHNKKKPENHIPRPPNAFILFRSSFIKSQHVSTEVETNHSTLSKIIGLTWQNLPPEERQVWHGKAKAAQDEHRRRFPQYAFRPLHTKKGGTAEKRKVREVGPKDQKRCEKIAALLVEGKKGQELDVAIQEFDRHHVPEIVTRFEAPITAHMYRRSSSAPLAETEHSRDEFLPSSPPHRPRGARASSAQPIPAHLTNEGELGEFSMGGGAYCDASFPPIALPGDYSFPTKSEPSFEFTTFSFDDNIGSCDPLAKGPGDPAFELFGTNDSSLCTQRSDHFQAAPLFVNSSFADEWVLSPASSSPATPVSCPSMHSPSDFHTSLHSSEPFTGVTDLGAFAPDAFDLGQPAKGWDISALDAFSPKCGNISAFDGAFSLSSDLGGALSAGSFLSFDGVKPESAHLDQDLSVFMSSLPAYTI